MCLIDDIGGAHSLTDLASSEAHTCVYICSYPRYRSEMNADMDMKSSEGREQRQDNFRTNQRAGPLVVAFYILISIGLMLLPLTCNDAGAPPVEVTWSSSFS